MMTQTRMDGYDVFAHADGDRWASTWASLPVEIHGSAPGHAGEALTSLAASHATRRDAAPGQAVTAPKNGRIILYVNAAALPPKTGFCKDEGAFRPGQQTGPRLSVTALLCNGADPISRVRGSVRSQDQSAADVLGNLGVIEEGLVTVLLDEPSD